MEILIVLYIIIGIFTAGYEYHQDDRSWYGLAIALWPAYWGVKLARINKDGQQYNAAKREFNETVQRVRAELDKKGE